MHAQEMELFTATGQTERRRMIPGPRVTVSKTRTTAYFDDKASDIMRAKGWEYVIFGVHWGECKAVLTHCRKATPGAMRLAGGRKGRGGPGIFQAGKALRFFEAYGVDVDEHSPFPMEWREDLQAFTFDLPGLEAIKARREPRKKR